MRAGWLRHRVTIQEVTETQNAVGEPVETWADVATVWGSVEPLRGREFEAAGQAQARTDTRVRIRYFSGVAPKMRVVWQGHTFDIVSVVNPLALGRQLELMCLEVL